MVEHVIWCPKRRRKILLGPIHDRLAASIHEVAEERNWQISRLAIQPDQV
jgi:putative transposase